MRAKFNFFNKHCFTLVEVLVVMAIGIMILGALFRILKSGTRSAMRGMVQIETTLLARRILQQVRNDLELSCCKTPETSDQDGEIALSIFFKDYWGETKKDPFSFSFLSFPIDCKQEDVVPPDDLAKIENKREPCRITYSLKPSNNPFFKTLTRSEKFKGILKTRILSEKVNYMDIIKSDLLKEPGFDSLVNTGDQKGLPTKCEYFFVKLQLCETFQRSGAPTLKGDRVIREEGVIVADFFDVVIPDFLTQYWKQQPRRFNYHSHVNEPASP
ncbi:hypothetical protein HYY75_04610 [bacterium]|nr:hypothetical protein [bacterium]